MTKLTYNPETGEFFDCDRLLVSRAKSYRKIRGHYAHRLAWKIMTGDWPTGQIDHINGDVTDNRWCNLREVSVSENQKNAKRSARNTSGMVGVRRAVKGQFNKWHAFITHDSKLKSLGYFHCLGDAIAARRTAERELGFHPNHGRAV